MKPLKVALGCVFGVLLAQSVWAQAPSLTGIQTPYANLPSAVTMAGETWTSGTVAYGPVNTPVKLIGSNFGSSSSSGTVSFIPFNGGVAGSPVVVPEGDIDSWSSTAIFLTVPYYAFPGVIEVTTTAGTSDPLPFIVMPGNYIVNSATCDCPELGGGGELEITTVHLPTGTVGSSYSTSMTAANGTGSLTWTLTGNPLPSGLSMSSSGVISGTPTNYADPIEISFEVADSASHTASATLLLSIGAPEPYSESTALYNYCISSSPSSSCSSPSGGYDAAGNILSYGDSVTGTWSMASGYDSLNRLTAATPSAGQYSGLAASWTYDSFGNVTAENLTGTLTSSTPPSIPSRAPATYDANNHISTVTDGYPPQYDSAGNITCDSYDSGATIPCLGPNKYLYDADGRICAVKDLVGSMIGYLYDAEGNRVAKGSIFAWNCDTNPGDEGNNGFVMTASYILGSNNEQLTELNWSSGTPYFDHTNVFAQGAGLVATYDTANYPSSYPDVPDGTILPAPAMHLQFSDWLGTRRVQTNYAGYTEMSYLSLPFGDGLFPQSASGCNTADDCYSEDATEHHFTGKEHDNESANDYFEARYYASSMGRFLSPDPSQLAYADPTNPQSLNLYSYVYNNPLINTDPSGMGACDPNDNNVLNGDVGFEDNENDCAQFQSDSQQMTYGMLANPNQVRRDPNNPNGFIMEGESNHPGTGGCDLSDPICEMEYRDLMGQVQTVPLQQAPTPWYKNSCITSALGSGAVSVGLDSIGLIPVAGGAGSLARTLGHQAGYVGIVADNLGGNIIKSVQGTAGTVRGANGLFDTSTQGLISDGLAIVGFIPGLGQAAAVGSIINDAIKTGIAISKCP